MKLEAEIEGPKPTSARSTFTEEIFDAVCDRMADGEGLREICRDPEMPSRSTVLRWIENDTGRQAKYQKAREALMDHYAEEIRTIAWDDSQDTIKREGKADLCNHEWIGRSRLKVDTLKFLMAKLHPKRYGDKTELLALAAPDAAAGQMAIKWADSVHVIVYPMLRDDGTLIPASSPEYDAAIEKAANEARARHADPLTGRKEATVGIDLKRDEPPRPPAQITYQPEPLPGGLSESDWAIMGEVLRLIKQTIPTDDTSPPGAIFNVIRQALLLHFREVEIETTA